MQELNYTKTVVVVTLLLLVSCALLWGVASEAGLTGVLWAVMR